MTPTTFRGANPELGNMERIEFHSLRERLRLEDYVQRLGVRLRRCGNHLIGRCPIHNEQRGEAFSIDPKTQRWRCWGKCDRGGDVLDLDLALYGGTISGAARRLGAITEPVWSPVSQQAKNREPYQLKEKDCDLMARSSVMLRKQPDLALRIRPKLNLDAVHYVASDGDLGFVEDLAFGARRGPALIFGYSHGLKARWPGKEICWLCGSAGNRCWRDSLLIPSHKKVYLTEGETDALTLIGDGLDVPGETLVVALPGASAQITPSLFAARSVTLVFDNDEAGQKATRRIANQLDGIADVSAFNWKGVLPA